MAASIGNRARVALNLRYFKGFQQISLSNTRYITHTNKVGDSLWLTTSKRLLSSNTECQNSGQLNTTARLCQSQTQKRNLRSTTNPAWAPTKSTLTFATQSCRGLATGGEVLDARQIKYKVDDIAAKFTEARDLLEDARDVKGTVYFSEDMEEAAEAVDDTLKDYKNLLSLLNEEQKQDVLRTIGLKMEELKAQKTMLEEEMIHDE